VSDTGTRAGAPSHLVVGHMAKVHGTKGEVYVWPLTDHIETVFAPGETVWVGDGEGMLVEDAPILEVERSRPFKRGLLIGFRDHADRNAVEALVGRYLLMPVSLLDPPASDEWYYHQLLGLEVVTVSGQSVGRVREVYELDPTDLLDVEGADGRSRLIPFARRIVRRVDIEAGRLVIEPPDGLLDL